MTNRDEIELRTATAVKVKVKINQHKSYMLSFFSFLFAYKIKEVSVILGYVRCFPSTVFSSNLEIILQINKNPKSKEMKKNT